MTYREVYHLLCSLGPQCPACWHSTRYEWCAWAWHAWSPTHPPMTAAPAHAVTWQQIDQKSTLKAFTSICTLLHMGLWACYTYSAKVIALQIWSRCFAVISLLRISLHSCTSPIAMLCLLFQVSEFCRYESNIMNHCHKKRFSILHSKTEKHCTPSIVFSVCSNISGPIFFL